MTLLEQLDTALARHDWFYQYSDDHRYWRAGQTSLDNINTLMRQCKEADQDEEAKALFAKHRPANY